MTVSFQAFRDRYPDAHITSDVLLVQRDRFVVKVTVVTTSAGCATGLAAHEAIEVAEDQARARAFAALGWAIAPLPPTGGDPASRMAEGQDAKQERELNGTVKPAPDPSFSMAAEPTLAIPEDEDTALPIADISEPVAPAAAPSLALDEPLTATPPLSLEVPAMAQSAAAALPPTQSVKSPKTKPVKSPPNSPPAAPESAAPDAPAAIAPNPESPPPVSAEAIPPGALPDPINLSDVIAQTDIELRRLGWSVETGRDYLEKTYQKRSRHELSEEELIQFLCHLESL